MPSIVKIRGSSWKSLVSFPVNHFQQNYYNSCTTCHDGPYVSNNRTRLRRSDHSPCGDWGFSIWDMGTFHLLCVKLPGRIHFGLQ